MQERCQGAGCPWAHAGLGAATHRLWVPPGGQQAGQQHRRHRDQQDQEAQAEHGARDAQEPWAPLARGLRGGAPAGVRWALASKPMHCNPEQAAACRGHGRCARPLEAHFFIGERQERLRGVCGPWRRVCVHIRPAGAGARPCQDLDAQGLRRMCLVFGFCLLIFDLGQLYAHSPAPPSPCGQQASTQAPPQSMLMRMLQRGGWQVDWMRDSHGQRGQEGELPRGRSLAKDEG